jgi:hypothetical protein
MGKDPEAATMAVIRPVGETRKTINARLSQLRPATLTEQPTDYYAKDVPQYLRAAYQFGAQAVADRESVVCGPENQESIAYYHEAGAWHAMPVEDRDAALDAWRTGVEAEWKAKEQ